MTLPNGETIREGEYGVTRDGRKVGPMRHAFGEIWDCKEVFPGTGNYHWLSDGRRGSGGCKSCPDIIAKLNPVEAGPDPVKSNYNDGKFHGWNGGQCPVHPESVVEVMFWDGEKSSYNDKAGNWHWGGQGDSTIIAFRVITPYVEPAPAPVMTTPRVARYDLRGINFARNASSIAEAFIWDSTPEGRDFWQANKKTPEGLARWEQMKTQFDAQFNAEHAPDPVKPAKRDLRTIDEPFYRLDKKTQGRLRKADAKGFPLQTKGLTHDGSTGAEWGPISKNGWYRDETVRLDPTFTPPAKRVKSKPACATITQTMWRSENGCLYGFRPKNGVPVTITFTRTNGMVDNDSYKVEVKG